VHFQDEICQMKGHNHAWQVDEVSSGGRGFTARVMNGDKLFDPNPGSFELDAACRILRGGKKVEEPGLAKDERLYLTWCYEGARRVVKLMCDAASLDALQAEGQKRAQERIARDGMGGFVEAVDEGKARLLVFSTFWSQAAALKAGQALTLKIAGDGVDVRIASRKNLGAYGSGPSEILLEGVTKAGAETLRRWTGGKIVHVFAKE
jgi:hypothetical protein